MATVNRPGQKIARVLPSDRDKPEEEQTVLVIRVLEYEEWRSLAKGLRIINESTVLEQGRRILGRALEEVRNLHIRNADGSLEEFHLEKAGGLLTEESASILKPYIEEIIPLIDEAQTFDFTAAKN